MTTTAPRSTSGYEMAKRLQNEPITLSLLHEAVDNINPVGYECIPISDGMDWITDHTQQFLELLEADGVSVEEFFRSHLHMNDVRLLLINEWLLWALGDDRLVFIREVFLAVSSMGHVWLKVALRVGITLEQLAEMILEKLHRYVPDTRYNIYNFTEHDFVEYGAGRVERTWRGDFRFENYEPTYWSVLSGDELIEACRIIIGKRPGVLFGGPNVNHTAGMADKLAVRLGNERVAQLLEEAAEALTGLDELINLKVVARLPLAAQLKLARRLQAEQNLVWTPWVIDMVLAEKRSASLALLQEFEANLSCGLVDYQRWYARYERIKQGERGNPVIARRIDELLRRLLKEQGYTLGLLCEEKFRGTTQLYVQVGKWKFVKDRGMTTYYRGAGEFTRFPQVGDVVAFRAGTGRELVPGRVWTATFTLVHRIEAEG